ncbi:MAG: hypothetical protein NVS3B20_04220 [Polyangiales bacterium]
MEFAVKFRFITSLSSVTIIPFLTQLTLIGAVVAVGCSAGHKKEAVAVSLTNDTGPGETNGVEPDAFVVGLDIASEVLLDPEKDNDGDGWLFKEDCNDANKEVNPGAYEVLGDGVDNDCDGKVDNPEPDCDQLTIPYNSTDALDFAKSLGICRFTKADAVGKDKRWGIVKAELVSADGTGTPDPIQYGILKKFGGNVSPLQGKTFAVLSSGTARTPDYPGFVTPLSPSWTGGSSVTPPAGWPRNTDGCPEPSQKKANDSANLKLTIRVPTNAHAFLYNFNFYSSEYINYVCSAYNDTFVAILHSKAPLDPKYAGNISFDAKGNPVNVNSGFFEVCTPGTKSVGGKSFSFPCAKTTKELEGSGFWDDARPSENGATSWLETKAPVVAGETMTIEFMVWDTSDHVLDSSILVDNWRWDAKGTTGPSTERPK